MKSFTLLFRLLLFLIFFLTLEAYAQNSGSLSGRIIDSESGELIIGANVLIEGYSLGAATDIDGVYSIRNIPPGKYNLIVSFISYSKTTVRDIEIIENKNTTVDLALKTEAIQVDEVVIFGQASGEYEAALLNQRKKSIQIIDGLSAESIKKSNDSNTAETLRRVPGITLLDNKYIFVRGVSERYSGALLNNSPLATTEPDKKDFAFDLIPSNLIENTLVVKSFTPDEPGDFAGGLVKVNTVDFPGGQIFTLNYTSSYTDNSSTKSFISYKGGSTDFLGIDDGTRELPDGFPDNLSQFNEYQDTLYKIARTLENTWPNLQKKAPLNQSFKLTYGDQFHVFEQPFGLISSLSYKDEYNISSLITRDLTDEGYFFDYEGEKYQRNVHWGALLNLAYKFDDLHKLMLKNNFTQDADDETFIYRGDQYDRSSNVLSNALRFVSRSLYSSQIAGESYFPAASGVQIDWRFSYSQSFRNEPDYRRYYYARDLDSENEEDFLFAFPASPSLREGGRFYSDLNEYKRSYNIDITKSIGSVKFKFGSAYSNTSRSFNSRLIGMLNPFNLSAFRRYAIDSLFNPENFFYGGLAIGEYTNPTNKYTAGDENFASYFMVEIPLTVLNQNFTIVTGLRNENYILRLRTSNFDTRLPVSLNYINPNLLPSVNLIYRLSENANIRLSYNKTLNRPQLREIAPFNYYDFQDQTNISGNIYLKEAKITNYDLRVESFPNLGELLSLSLFYKEIQNPIEKVILASSSNNVRTFINGPFARNWGFEVEIRSSLGNIIRELGNFTFIGNYTRLWSEIKEFQEGAPSRLRNLQGQSPYVINLSLNYDNAELGAEASILYYRFGERIVEVASIFNSDWIEKPRDLVDIVITKDLWSHFELKFGIKDLLSQDYLIKEKEETVRKTSTNTKYSLGVSYHL